MGTSINADLRLEEGTARVWSPLLWPSPRDKTFEAWVGRRETDEFLRQSKSIVPAWKAVGVKAHYLEIAGHDHFSVLHPFANPESELTARLANLAVTTK
jgi:arylformamidase